MLKNPEICQGETHFYIKENSLVNYNSIVTNVHLKSIVPLK